MRQVRTIDLIPGELAVALLAAKAIDGRDVWVFASQGLIRRGQRELLLSVAMEAGDGADGAQAPDFPQWLIRETYSVAGQQGPLEAGTYTSLPAPSWGLGITGFYYLDYPEGADLYPDGLAPLLVVPLLHEETVVLANYGRARVLALLDAQAGTFPYPAYHDRRRPPVTTMAAQEGSLLSKISMLHAAVVEVAINEKELRVTVPPDRTQWLAESVRSYSDQSIAFLTAPLHTVAPQRFVWTSDGTPTTIGSPESGDPLVAGNFLMLVVSGERVSTRAMEDGLAVVLSARERDKLVDALERGREYSCHADGPKLVVTPAMTTHVSPFGIFHSEGGFRLHQPAGAPRRTQLRSVQVSSVVILSDESAVAEEIAVEDFATFHDQLSAIVDDAVTRVGFHGETIVLGLELAPERPLHIELALQGAFPSDEGQALVNRLNAVAPPRVRERVLAFELWYKVLHARG